MRGVAMVMSFSSTKHCGKYSQCPAFDIKQSPAKRSPEDHQVHTHIYPYLNKAQSYFHASFIYFFCVLWFECVLQNTFIGFSTKHGA